MTTQEIKKLLIKETNKQKLSYDQLKNIFREVRSSCGISPTLPSSKLYDLPTSDELSSFYQTRWLTPIQKLLFKTLEGTGLRVSELCNLLIKDIDFKSNTIFVRNGKGHKDRITVFGNTLSQDLQLYLQGKPNKYLFESNRNTKYSPRQIERICEENKTRASISKKFTPHTFRHLYFTKLATHQVSKEYRAMLAGHSNDSTQDIYTHLGIAGIKDQLIKILDQK
jgi:site-specific recombinase XerD